MNKSLEKVEGFNVSEPIRKRMRIAIIVPCFNEEDTIPHLVSKLEGTLQRIQKDFEVELVLIDDGSQDKTNQLLQRAFSSDSVSVKIIKHASNRGLGVAQRSGFEAATADYVVTMDSDCTYDPMGIADMLALMTPDTDVVIASPYHPQGRVLNVPRYRLFLSRNLSRVYNRLLNARLYTYTSLFRVYRGAVIKQIQFQANGFLSTAEILADVIRKDFKIKEYPAQLQLRQYGVSKIKIAKVIVEHLRFISKLFLQRLKGENQSRQKQKRKT